MIFTRFCSSLESFLAPLPPLMGTTGDEVTMLTEAAAAGPIGNLRLMGVNLTALFEFKDPEPWNPE